MKEVTFSIKDESIIKQVKAKAYYTGRSRGGTSAQESIITDILDSDNKYFIVGSLNSAAASVQSAIGAYAPCRMDAQTDGFYQFAITVPDHFDDSSLLNLQANAYQYCEAKVLYDWFATTSPSDANTYAQLMTQALAEIQSNMRRRVHPSSLANTGGQNTESE